jgi:hypothetical protein
MLAILMSIILVGGWIAVLAIGLAAALHMFLDIDV